MASAEELQGRLEALRRIRATGARSVTYADGREITFRSDKDLVAAIDDLENQIAGRTLPRFINIRSTKGW
ncbi:MAG: hypothetical protein ROR55_03400 [Devosia sp.]